MKNLDRLSSKRDIGDLDILAAAAEGQQIKFNDIEVIADASNLIVLLQGADIVVRSPGSTRLVRDSHQAMIRELVVTSYLRDNGLPIVPPLFDQPVQEDGLLFSFWEYVEDQGNPDPEKVGWALLSCHEALQSFDLDKIDRWTIIDEAIDILANGQYQLAIEASDRQRAMRFGKKIRSQLNQKGPIGVVHGDAHWRNVINTRQGPLWNDWDDVHLAPLVWDLACLRTSSWFNKQIKRDARIALEAYGPAEDLTAAKQGRIIEHIAWGSLLAVYYQEDAVGHSSMVKELVDDLERAAS